MEPTTLDYTQSQLTALLTGILDASELIKIANHFPNGAIVATDTGGPYSDMTQVPDPSGNDPNLLLLEYSNETVDLSQFSQPNSLSQSNPTLSDDQQHSGC